MAFTSPNLQMHIARLTAVPARLQTKVAAELYASCEEVMTEAKDETPVDTGNLRASGHVQEPVIDGTSISVELGFGGPAGSGTEGESNDKDVGYALFVHEDLEKNHPVGKAKFLEDPLRASIERIQTNLQQSVAESWRGDEGQ